MRITGFERKGRRRPRIVVLLDGRPWAELDPETVVREGLARGQTLDARRRAAILAADEAIRARQAAAASIARAPRTRREVEARLRERGFRRAAVERAVTMLAESGTLDDRRLVERFVAARRRKGDWGPVRIADELRRRGVEAHLAEQAAAEAVPREERAARCLDAARKLAPRYQPLAEPRRRAALAAALLRRGWEADDVQTAIERLAGGELDA